MLGDCVRYSARLHANYYQWLATSFYLVCVLVSLGYDIVAFGSSGLAWNQAVA